MSRFALRVAEQKITETSGGNAHRVSVMVQKAKETVDDALLQHLAYIDTNGDGEIDADEIIAFAKHFAEQQVALAEESAKRELAEIETKAMRTRVWYLLMLVLCMGGLLCASTAMNVVLTIRGTRNVVKEFHYTETRGDVLSSAEIN